MNPSTSVSKGIVICNEFKLNKSTKKRKSSLLLQREPWYEAYKRNWDYIEQQLQDLHHCTYGILLDDIVNYIKTLYEDEKENFPNIIPSVTLLAGVNQPDHISQFTTLINKLRNEVSPHIAMVNSQDATSVEQLIENVVYQLMYEVMESSSDEEYDELCNNFSNLNIKLKKSECTLTTLRKWYQTTYGSNFRDSAKILSPKKKKKQNVTQKKALVVIIPDFESFNYNILQDFVLIISSYIWSLPIVLVFGVATSVAALHKSFPYHVSSKLLIKVFQSHSSPAYMNQVLEEIFLTHKCPFQMSGKVFQLLTDVFLFYDFSVTGFIESVKYCMMEHFYRDKIKLLCCEQSNVDEALSKLENNDLEDIRRLMSFRPYLEKQHCKTKIALFENDEYFRDDVHNNISKFHDYLLCYYTSLRILCVFVKDFPKNIIGKTIREIHSKCSMKLITETQEFKDNMQLLKLQSQVTLLESVKESLNILNAALQIESPIKLRSSPKKNSPFKELVLDENVQGQRFLKNIKVHLLIFLRHMESASQKDTTVTQNIEDGHIPTNRYQLKEKLLNVSRVHRVQSEFEMVRGRLVSYLEDMFTKTLQPAKTLPYHEIFVYDDIASVKKQIVGSPRSAVHTALTNPTVYLQCSCCVLPNPSSVLSSLIDECIAYKLHLECGTYINLYDWLQAFAAIVDGHHDTDHDERTLSPAVQARFNRAVGGLQILGFIKSTKRKTDHMMRLTS